jgi:Tol biopolymer transport system component
VAVLIGSSGAVTSLEVVDVVNGARTMIAPGPASIPKWSPDGQWLAYVDADGLRVVLASGGDAHLIARDADTPDWSRDGTELAYALRPGLVDPDGDAPIHVVQRDGSNDHPLKDPNDGGATKDTAPVFAPDGAHLLLDRQNADGSQLAVVAATNATSWRSFPNFVDEVGTNDVAWFDSSSVFLVEIGWYRLDLVAIDGSGQRPATDGVLRQAATSSDGTMLAWITQEGEVRVRDLRTDAETELVPTGGPSSGFGMGLLTWSPDNAAVAFRGNDQGWSVYRVDGSAQWAFTDA